MYCDGPIKLTKRYLFHMIWSTQFREYASASFKGAVGQQRASDSVVGDFGIPLPPLAEQRRIADLLDQADALRRKRRAALGLLDELLRSTFLEMFGDPVTNPKGWPAKSLAEVALITTGNTPPRDESSYYGSQMAWLKSDNLGHLHSWPTPAEERLSIEGVVRGRTATAGSILVTCIAGSPDSIGKASLLAEEAAFNQQINALTPGNDLLSEYLYALIRCGKRLVQQQSTDGMKGLVSKGRLGEVKVPVPPLLNQRRFRAFFNTWDESCRHALSHAEATEFLFQSLLHQAFQGQL
jgi:type I restriction enzyme S subunit